MLAKPLATCTHLYWTVSQLFEPQVQKIAVFTYRSPHFCFPWGRPWGNHVKCCMDGKWIRCLQIVSQHVLIYLQQFPSYSNRNLKKSPFSRNAAHIFISPGDAPANAIITQFVAWMERKFNACQTPHSIYLSIFNSFRVIRCLSQCVSPNIAIFTTFLPRDAMHKRGLCCHAVSVHSSVCPSRSWITSKRINISSKCFHHRVATPY